MWLLALASVSSWQRYAQCGGGKVIVGGILAVFVHKHAGGKLFNYVPTQGTVDNASTFEIVHSIQFCYAFISNENAEGRCCC